MIKIIINLSDYLETDLNWSDIIQDHQGEFIKPQELDYFAWLEGFAEMSKKYDNKINILSDLENIDDWLSK